MYYTLTDTINTLPFGNVPLILIQPTGNVDKNLKLLEDFIQKRTAEVTIKNIEERGLNIPTRVESLKLNMSNVLYDFVRASLFDRDKLTVATMFTFKAMIEEGELEQIYVDVITRGREAEDVPSPGDEVYKWCSEAAWARVKAIEEVNQSTLGFIPSHICHTPFEHTHSTSSSSSTHLLSPSSTHLPYPTRTWNDQKQYTNH